MHNDGILSGVSFSVRQGETPGLAGESGCGVSTPAAATLSPVILGAYKEKTIRKGP